MEHAQESRREKLRYYAKKDKNRGNSAKVTTKIDLSSAISASRNTKNLELKSVKNNQSANGANDTDSLNRSRKKAWESPIMVEELFKDRQSVAERMKSMQLGTC